MVKNGTYSFYKFYAIIIAALALFVNQTNAQELTKTLRVKVIPALSSAINIQNSADGSFVETGIVKFDELNSKYTVTDMKRAIPYNEKYEARHRKHGLHLWYEINVSGSFTNEQIINDYSKLSEITVAELKTDPQLIEPGEPVIYNASTHKSANTDLPYNDPLLDKQWHYHNYGQSGGKAGADIRLFNAWLKETGSSNIIVSVHDQGVDTQHEDLKDAMWINEAEYYGITGKDDDGNGYVDDIHGYNFVEVSGNIPAEYHATHVAGTIGATNNNGKGVSGIAGGTGNNDGVKIMSCRILGAPDPNVAASFVYAADNGAVISQNSWGFVTPGTYSELIHDAIDYFIEEAGNYPGSPMKGGVVIFAVGNLGLEGEFYPAAYEPVVSVTALSSENIVAPYSNYGSWIDIAAPGGNNGDDAVLTGKDASYQNAIMSTLNNNEYGFLDGTSMACPHVSGVAALIASKFQGEDFTNEKLLTHLLTAYNDSIYDIEHNHDYKGKLGLGLINADLALDTDNGIAPNKVTDLKLTGDIAQDFITVEWTVPKDNDDGSPFNYEIIYSKKAISEASLNEAEILRFEHDTVTGAKLSYEIGNLSPVTTYNIAVRYIDRWGNKAAFSNIVSATTNAGPIVKLSKESLKISINVKQEAPVKKDSFLIINEGEGVLRWNMETRHSSGTPYSLNNPLPYPAVEMQAYATKRSVLQSAPVQKIQSYNIEPDHNEEYSDLISDSYLIVIGESNTKLPNSSASRFVVSNEKGFNLTHVDTYLEIDDSTYTPVVEIYKGESIESAQLLLRQYLKDTDYAGIFTRITLDEQIFFEENEVFWIVFHIPTGNLYPLGAGIEATPEGSQNSWLSFDYGKSWTMLEELIPDDFLVWAVYAMSRYEKLDEYIKLSATNGELYEGDTAVVVATVDGENMVDGLYKGNLLFYTNETGKEQIRMPAEIDITGHKPEIQTPARLDFGTVLLGYKKTLEFTFKNVGLSRFDVKQPYFEISDDQFEYVQGINTVFDAGDEQKVYFSFAPEKTGLTITNATLIDENGDSYTFELVGTGLEPPVATLLPEELTHNNVTIGDTLEGKFVIKNDGEFTLDYFMPTFADGHNMENIPKTFHKFGYRTKIYKNGNNYNWTEISETGIDATQDILNSSSKIRDIPHVKVDFGFSFPFFGTGEDSVIITSYGLVSFDLHHHMWSGTPMYFNFNRNADRFISAWGSLISLSLDKEAKIYYQKYPDKLIVQYNNANFSDELSGQIYGKSTFQIVLHENGNIYFYYKNAKQEDWYTRWDNRTIFQVNGMVGIKDRYLDDGVYIHDYDKPNFDFAAESTIEFLNPGYGLYFDVEPTFGSVKPGATDTITYKIKTDSLNVCTHYEILNIVTNDAYKILAPHTAKLEITNGAEPQLSLSTNNVDFGDVFQGDTKPIIVELINKGKAPATISNITNSDLFTVSGISLPYFLGPLKKVELQVDINTNNLGLLSDEIRLTTDSETQLALSVKGEIIPAPQISIEPKSIVEMVMAGDSLPVKVTVSNTGENTLEFAMQGNKWVTISNPSASKTTKQVQMANYDYAIYKSTDDNGPEYEWIELAETGIGTKLEIDPYEVNFSDWIELPFDFNFYGTNYNKIIVSANGFITFTDEYINLDKQWSWGGGTIPDTAGQNNYIAAMWYGGGFAFKEYYPYTGVYYKMYDDYAVVEYKNTLNGFDMGYPISHQIILYNNGKIKFQYQFDVPEMDYNMNYASIGIENQDGTNGELISHDKKTVTEDMSILLVPMETYHVAAGEKMELSVLLDAENLYQDYYSYQIDVPNNAPNGLNLTVPIEFGVAGIPELQLPDSVDFGTKTIIEGNSDEVTREFSVSNPGTSHLYLSGIKQLNPDDYYIEVHLEQPNSITGELDWYWVPLLEPNTNTSQHTPITLKAGTKLDFRVSFNPEKAGNIFDTLILNSVLRAPQTDTIFLYALCEQPPVIDLNKNEFEYYAKSDAEVASMEFAIDNFKGATDLNYEISVDYVRESGDDGVVPYPFKSAELNSIVAAPALAYKEYAGTKRAGRKSASTQLFNRVLSYENAEYSEINLGFGGGFEFDALTRFNAPDDGYNLTHVQTWYAPGELLNSTITINVYSGNSIADFQLSYTQDFNYIIDEPDTDGKLITIELDEPVVFFPGESFFIEIHYGIEQLFPQGLAAIDNPIANTFFFGNGAQYFDMSESDFANYAWITRAAELEFASGSWILLNADKEGVIQPEKDASIAFDVLAAYTEFGTNTANIHIKSNDPLTPDTTISVVVNHNYGPEFSLSETELSVQENDTLVFQVSAHDREHDSFEISHGELPAFVSISKEDTIYTITCTPTFTDKGEYNIEFEGTDINFNTGKSRVKIYVYDKNRAPEANELETLIIGMNEIAGQVTGSELFVDPDGDEVSLLHIELDNSVYETYKSGDNFLLKPIQLGEGLIKFVGTDVHGASTEKIIKVIVTSDKGALGDGAFNAYPNPANDIINFSTQNVNTIRTQVTITDLSGVTVLQSTIEVNDDRTGVLNVSNLQTGFYNISLSNCRGKCNFNFSKY